MKEIVLRIEKLIKENNKTAKQVLEDIGLQKNALSEWKNGRIKPSALTIIEIANYFGVTTDYLLGRTDIETASLSEQDKKLLKAYHEKTEMQEAVNRLLSLTTDDNISPIQKTQNKTTIVKKAAFGGGTKKETITEEEAKKREIALEKITKKFPSVDD